MPLRLTRRLACAALCSLVALTGTALAQNFPNKPIRLVVPYGAGGPSDIAARVIAEEMGRKLGQPMIVDNRPGAGSMLGTELVVRSPADGYTLLLTDLPVTIVPHVLSKSVKYHPVRDLEPIGLIGGSTLAFYAGEHVKARTVAEFVTNAKIAKEEARIGSGGNGSLTHLLAEVYAQAGGFQMAHVPYQGSGPAIPDLLAGRLDGMFVNYLAIQPHLAGGRVRPLGSASRTRAEELPNVSSLQWGVSAALCSCW